MKAYLLFLYVIPFWAQSMQQSLAPCPKINDGFFKELRMQFHEDPSARTIVKTCGGIMAAFCLFRPMNALATATVAGLAGLAAYWQDRELSIKKRKEDKDLIAYGAFANGPQALIETVCQTDEYQQTDIPSLQKQNTIFLIEVLKRYYQNPGFGHYPYALEMLKKHHADLHYAYDHFKKMDENKDALKWLARNGLHLEAEQKIN